MQSNEGLVGTYNYPLVALSVFIAVVASFVALYLSRQLTARRGALRWSWLCGGSIALGTGIWGMHYLGMQAYQLPIQVQYDWPTVLLSLLTAIVASCWALFVASRPVLPLLRNLMGGIIMGTGIAAMHYIGMAAMRLQAMCTYSPALVALSALMAIAGSFLALRLISTVRIGIGASKLRLSGSAFVLGVVISSMHYVGMAAVTFRPSLSAVAEARHPVSFSTFGVTGIAVVTLAILALALVTSMMDRRASLHAEQLADKASQIETVFDNLKEGVILMDMRGNWLRINHMASTLLGVRGGPISPERAAQQFDVCLPTGEVLPPEELLFLLARKGTYVQDRELKIVRKDNGTAVFIEASTAPVRNADGEVIQIISTFRDLTNRREAAEEIRRQQSQLQNIFDNLNEGIVLMDMDRNIIQINRAASRLLGIKSVTLPRETIAGTFVLTRLNGEHIPQEQWPSSLALKGVYVENCELKVRRTDTGDTIISQISTSPVLDESGKAIQIILSYRDITRPKQIDEDRTRLAEIVDSSEDAIIGKDAIGIISSWNMGAEKIFGYTAVEMIGQSITCLLPDDRLDEESGILARIRRGEMVDHIETVRKRKNGQFIDVSLTISPIRNAFGAVVGASKVARNITDRKKLERQLHQSQKMDAIGQLTGGIAHDFNNLLAVVIGNLDLLEGAILGNEVALKRAHTAHKAAIRGAELTRRLLAFSSQQELSPKPIDLGVSIHNTIELATRGLGPEIRITRNHDTSIPRILADAAGLESALLNLFVNARDAMPSGGTITVTSNLSCLDKTSSLVLTGELKVGQYACVSVSDTGHGMSRETVARIFEPFFTTKAPGKGTGLGLAMVYGFFRQSGGAVHVYSEPGYGTTVTAYLPLAMDAPDSIHEALEPEITIQSEATVLIVDDEPDLLEIARAYMEDVGYEVFDAVDGPAALDVLAHNPIVDLLITDIIMPGGMNGVELAQRVRTLNPGVKVIYCSGFPADALVGRSMALIDGPLLRKPYQRAEFGEIVRRVMKSRSHKELKASEEQAAGHA